MVYDIVQKDAPVAPQASGSKTLIIPSLENKASISMVTLSAIDTKMRQLSNSFSEIKNSMATKDNEAIKNEDYLKLCTHLKELIASVEGMSNSKAQLAEQDEDDYEGQGNGARLKESITDIKQSMKLIEDRYTGLSNLAGDSAPQNKEKVNKYQ